MNTRTCTCNQIVLVVSCLVLAPFCFFSCTTPDMIQTPLAMSFSMTGERSGIVITKVPDGIKAVFPRTNPRNRWPGVLMSLPEDCSAFTAVKVECSLTDGFSGNLYIRLDGKHGKRTFRDFPVKGKDRQTYIMPIDSNHLDRRHMASVNIYLSHPPFDSEFTFHAISLVNDLPLKLKQERRRFEGYGSTEALRHAYDKLIRDVAETTINPIQGMEQFRELDRQLKANIRANIIRETRELHPQASFGIATCTSMEKALPDAHFGIPGFTPAKLYLELARNEHETLQLLTIAPNDAPIKNLGIHLTSFKLKDATDVKLPAPTAAPVGFVTTSKSNVPEAHFGRYPDPILEFTQTVPLVKPGEIQSWIVRINTLPLTHAGIYTGKVSFAADHGAIATIPMEVRVFDFTLPQTPSLVTATSVYGSKAMEKRMPAFRRWILKNYHLNPYSIYSESAYGDPVLPSIREYQAARQDGLNFIPIVYLKLPRQALHSHKGIAPGKSKATWNEMTKDQQSKYPAEWKHKYLQILRKRIPELKKAGLYDIAACYGFDEAGANEWPAIIDLVKTLKAEFPDLRIVSTLFDASYGESSGLGGWIDGWIDGSCSYRFNDAKKARAKGRQVWYYTTKMTIDGDSLADIRALLGTRAFASQIDGWLVWTVSRWCRNQPITTVPETGWNPESFPGDNGGGSYFCMGPHGQFLPTLRAEAIRDGIEDHTYLTMLRQQTEQLPADSRLRKQADTLFQSLSRDKGATPEEQYGIRRQAAQLLEQLSHAK